MKTKTKINNQGYAEARITNNKILKEIKKEAERLNLPLLKRKWANI